MVEPMLEVVEQPRHRGYRFRYNCEGGSHGAITGDTSVKSKKKSYPTVRLHNWHGPVTFYVQCVTNEELPDREARLHPHELVSEKNCNDGIFRLDKTVSQPYTDVVFKGLVIQHCTKKLADKILASRIQSELLKKKRMQFGVGALTDVEVAEAKHTAKDTCKDLNLSVVRLKFEAVLGNNYGVLEAVSGPVFDSKAPGAAALRICKMDKQSGSCEGDEEVFLLCDKVQKDEISVVFQERDEHGNVKWESFAKFGPHDVHKQYAIVFRTPAYRSTDIETDVHVEVKLTRKITKGSDADEESEPVAFLYHPRQDDMEQVLRKRRKPLDLILGGMKRRVLES